MKNSAKLSALTLALRNTKLLKGHKLWLPTCFLLVTSPVLAGVQTPQNTETVTYQSNQYTITDASLWRADGPGSLEVDWSLSEQQWDQLFGRPPRARLGVGAIIDECVLGICIKAGAAAGIEFEAYVLPYLKADYNPGTFDATATYQPTVQYQYSGLGVDFFDLDTDDGFDESNSEFIVYAPSIKLETGLNINVDLNLFAEACLLGCFVDETYNLASVDFALPLLEVDTLNATARVFAPPSNALELTGLLLDLAQNPPESFEELADSVLYQDAAAAFGLVKETAWNAYKEELRNGSDADKDRLKDIEDAEGLIAKSPVEVTFSNPFTSEAEGVWGSNATASAEIGGDFLDVRLDVDKVLGYAFGLPDGASLSLEDFNIKNSPIDVEVTLFDIDAGPTIDLKTELALTPELMVDIAFSAPVLIKGEIGTQTHYSGTWEDIPDIALLAPESAQNVGAYENSGAVTATPTFSVEANLSNRTYLDVAAALEVEGPSASVGIDGFAELNIDPLFTYEVESDSIAQVDIYNETFNTGKWNSPAEDERNIGATRVGLAGETSGLGTAESLLFDPSGEIVFQARSKNRDDDIALGDDRVQQFITSQSLINTEKKLRGYEDTAFQNTDLSAPRLFEINDKDVKNQTENLYKIDVGQSAEVMTDGQIKVNKGSSYLIVGLGGSLELGAENFYGSSTGSLASGENYGLVNNGLLAIDGDVYMAVDTLAGNELDRYKFANNGTMAIGKDGSLKFDGKFENTGYAVNKGSVELTGDDNVSSGMFTNAYGAELDLYGNLDVSSTINNVGLTNNGTVTVRTGGELTFIANNTNNIANTNNGELIIEQGAQLELTAATGNSTGSTSIINTHIIDNSGFIINRDGQEMVNGKAGADWSDFRETIDPLALAREMRNTDNLSALTVNLADNQGNIRNAASEANIKRQQFISASGQFINDGKAFIENNAGGLVSAYENSKKATEDALLARDAAINSFVNPTDAEKLENQKRDIAFALWDACLFLCGDRPQTGFEYRSSQISITQTAYNVNNSLTENWKVVSENNIALLTAYHQENNSSNVRSKEKNYGDALRQLASTQRISSDIYNAIDKELEVQSAQGLGVLVNRRDAILINEGTLTNHSVLLNSTGADLYNDDGAEINNDGGYVRNSGLLVNQEGGQLTNTGVIDNGLKSVRDVFGILDMAQLINAGELTNKGEIVNNDTFVNYGNINNQTASAASTEAVIVNSGILSNLGQINNDAQVINDAGSELNNHGKIVNNGTITNDGVFNNGQNPYSHDGNIVSVSQVINDANSFYRNKQTLESLENSINKLDEQIRDSQARESLITLQENPLLPTSGLLGFVNKLINIVIASQNLALKTVYDVSLANAQLKTSTIEGLRDAANTERLNTQSVMSNLSSVSQQYYTDTNGNEVAGSLFVNLAAIASANTADLENNGTINNRGLFNNIANITNSESGVIANSGILMNGEQGSIENAGQLNIEQATITTSDVNGNTYNYQQNGMLISNGNIDNSGVIDISAGSLMNGTMEGSTAQLNNSGDINLSGIVTESPSVNDASVMVATVHTTASLINRSHINNQSGGSINIGKQDSVAAKNGLYSVDTLVNIGNINNESGASINNYGMLVNAGRIDNAAGASFISNGVLNNMESGEISFADSTTLDGFVVNNGLITMDADDILTLAGHISGNGTFSGNTHILGTQDVFASVNAGNSPGLLTFNGNVVAENVDWIFEIWGTDRGIGYDAIDIIGDFSLAGGMSLSILSLLDFDTLTSQEFNFFSITGDLFDAVGDKLTTSFQFTNFSDEMADNWAGSWVRNINGGWGLNLSFIGTNTDIYNVLPTARALSRLQVDVPEPSTLLIFVSGIFALFSRKVGRRKVH